MAQSLASSGTSAQIIYLPTAALQPVIQTRKCGRLPKAIINLRTIQLDRRVAAYHERLRLQEIEELSIHIGKSEYWLGVARKDRDDLIKAAAPRRSGTSHV